MKPDTKVLKSLKDELRNLTDKELAIMSRRRQLFDILSAECGDDKEARRIVRVIVFELERERINKLYNEDLEFLYEEEGDIDGSYN